MLGAEEVGGVQGERSHKGFVKSLKMFEGLKCSNLRWHNQLCFAQSAFRQKRQENNNTPASLVNSMNFSGQPQGRKCRQLGNAVTTHDRSSALSSVKSTIYKLMKIWEDVVSNPKVRPEKTHSLLYYTLYNVSLSWITNNKITYIKTLTQMYPPKVGDIWKSTPYNRNTLLIKSVRLCLGEISNFSK